MVFTASLPDKAATSGKVQVTQLPAVLGRDAASMGNKTILTWLQVLWVVTPSAGSWLRSAGKSTGLTISCWCGDAVREWRAMVAAARPASTRRWPVDVTARRRRRSPPDKAAGPRRKPPWLRWRW